LTGKGARVKGVGVGVEEGRRRQASLPGSIVYVIFHGLVFPHDGICLKVRVEDCVGESGKEGLGERVGRVRAVGGKEGGEGRRDETLRLGEGVGYGRTRSTGQKHGINKKNDLFLRNNSETCANPMYGKRAASVPRFASTTPHHFHSNSGAWGHLIVATVNARRVRLRLALAHLAQVYPLMAPGQLIGLVNLVVARRAQACVVVIAVHHRLGDVTQDAHHHGTLSSG
jgi:hypothetical protein